VEAAKCILPVAGLSKGKFRLNSLRNRRLLRMQYLRPLRRASSIFREFCFPNPKNAGQEN
jgi:hypothetical protein